MLRQFLRIRREPRSERVGDLVGPLERRVLDALWARATAASVRDLHADFPSIAYTTLMTTLDRLYRKGWLERTKAGRAFVYVPRYSRDALLAELARDAIERLAGANKAVLRPILSTLVDTLGERDLEALDELERLVRQRRAAGGKRGAP